MKGKGCYCLLCMEGYVMTISPFPFFDNLNYEIECIISGGAFPKITKAFASMK